MSLGMIRGVTLSIASLVLSLTALGGCEIVLRWARPAALRESRAYREHVYSDVYGWALRSSWRGQWRNGKSFSVNASGYRGRALTSPPRSGVRRVLMLGDSIAFGAGVDDPETFAERMQAPGSGFEVANLGVSGYGTDQELLKLEREGFGLRPQVVVLNFCVSNDYVDNMLDSYLHDVDTPKPRYLLDGSELKLQDAHLKRSWIAQAGLRLRERSHLFNALVFLADPPARADGPPGASSPEDWVSRQNRILLNFGPVADLTKRLVNHMAHLCRARGVGFVILLHPDRGSYLGDGKRVAPLEQMAADSRGIRVIDLRRRYWAAGLSYDRIAFDDIGHLTPTGHAFVAEILRQELRPDRSEGRETRTPPRMTERTAT